MEWYVRFSQSPNSKKTTAKAIAKKGKARQAYDHNLFCRGYLFGRPTTTRSHTKGKGQQKQSRTLQVARMAEVGVYGGEQRYQGILITVFFAPSFPSFIFFNSARQFDKKSASNIISSRQSGDSSYSFQSIFLFFLGQQIAFLCYHKACSDKSS
jgi:hypothetical protein